MDAPETIAQGPRREQYGRVAIALHWLTALLLVGSFTIGLSMVGLPLSRQKLQWYAWHKWIGITVFLVTSLRLAWLSIPKLDADRENRRRFRGRTGEWPGKVLRCS